MSDMDDDGDDPNHEKLGAHSAAHFLGAGDSQFVNDWFGVVDKRTDNTGAVDPDYAPSVKQRLIVTMATSSTTRGRNLSRPMAGRDEEEEEARSLRVVFGCRLLK